MPRWRRLRGQVLTKSKAPGTSQIVLDTKNGSIYRSLNQKKGRRSEVLE